MGTVSAIAFVVFLVAAGWWLYLRSGARAWTAERDPLGEPPLRMAALIAAIVVGVAVYSSGGGAAKHTSAMQQGADDVDGGFFSTDTETSEASATQGAPTARSEKDASAKDAASVRAKASGDATEPTPKPKRDPQPRFTADDPTGKLPSYGKLVVRARKAARARGAKIRWYPTLAAEAREATERRAR